MARDFGFGIVGLGTIADLHAEAIQAMSNGHLVAAFSYSGSAKAHDLAAQYRVQLYVGDWDAFLRHPGLDIITIATPSGMHLEAASAAAQAGVHVLCEKPLDVTLERCDRMIQSCEQAGVQLGGIFPYRLGEAVGALKGAIDAGRFGALTMCSAIVPWYRSQAYYDSADWRGTWELDGGGALMNQSIHTIDLLQWLAGPVTSVVADTANRIHDRIEVEDAAVAMLRYASGALGTVTGSTAMWPGRPIEIHVAGELGSVVLSGMSIAHWAFTAEQASDADVRHRLSPEATASHPSASSDPRAVAFENHQRQFENFVRSLEGQETLLVDGPEARKAVEMILAMYASAASRQPVTLPMPRTSQGHD